MSFNLVIERELKKTFRTYPSHRVVQQLIMIMRIKERKNSGLKNQEVTTLEILVWSGKNFLELNQLFSIVDLN